MLGVFEAALFSGNGVFTPAISVLDAVEGLGAIAPALGSYAVVVGVAVLIGLFALQRLGTAVVGKTFGPAMPVWFLTLAAIGLFQIVREPRIRVGRDHCVPGPCRVPIR